ncbi:MAG TPA: YfhO family protein [Thermoanaerobaculia bacterium]|nr:YfhO family protein [Thermoanaerobaculia bacterium]
MRRRMTALWPALLGAVWLLGLFAPVLSPARVLANRDIAAFHLPLRASFRDLAAFGLPVWNPWLHGGQPILSNPSYGAFYPPSWLIFAVSPAYALSLMAVLHAGLAFAGAWRLARHFGCGRGAAALAGVGYTGCGAFLSLLSAYTLLGGIAWMPWVLAWGDESLRLPAGGRWWRPALLAGGALGLQLLNGEPSTVLITGLALLALAVSAAGRRLAAAPRAVVPVLFAVLLAAVQILPTLDRLTNSARMALPSDVATLWSMPPQRLVEIVFPRFFGDPPRVIEGLYFGWKITDRGPYIGSLYPGLLLVVLGLSALLAGRIPRRAAWALAFVGGCFLALGRHNPVYEGLRRAIPLLAVLRYPEKFVILAVLALGFAAVLGWQRLLDDRDMGRPESANLPLALAFLALATAVTLTFLLFNSPRVAAWFVISHALPVLPAANRGLALEYLRNESWAMVRTAAAVTLFLGLCRWRRPPRRLLEVAAILLLAADLWHYGKGLMVVLPAEAYRKPPPLAAMLLPVRDRLFFQEVPKGGAQVLRRGGDPNTLLARSQLLQLKPYTAVLWRIPYIFDVDFDMMLTGWGQTADEILLRESAELRMMYRYLGAWNAGTLLLQKTFQQQVAELRDPGALPLRKVANPFVLPRFRFVPRVTFHAGHAAAYAAARAQAWTVARNEHCVRPRRPEETLRYRRPPRLLGIEDRGGRIQVRYRAEEGAFFVAAMTFDKGWRAFVDGQPLATYPTAACQLGVALPPGEHRLVLKYREPLVAVGASVSLLALAGAGLALGRRRTT